MRNTERVLAEILKIPGEVAAEQVAKLVEVAYQSEGGVIDPPRTVHDRPDFEDNLVLDLAAAVSALLVVSDDADLTFAAKVDGMRRHRHRR